MSTTSTCPNCGQRLKSGRVKTHASFVERRRTCGCGHADKIHVRIHEEILKVIEVVRRAKPVVRKRTLLRPTKKKRG